MGYGIAPNTSHFTGKTKSKRKHLKKWKPTREHKNKYASQEPRQWERRDKRW